MSFPPRHSSPPKRPKLSLQIKTLSIPQTFGKSATALKSDINPSSPTALNTLSNAYATAIENTLPQTPRPRSFAAKPSLRIQPVPSRPQTTRLHTNTSAGDGYTHPSERTTTPGLFAISYPDTPSSAQPNLNPTSAHPKDTSSTFTFTPPHSAGASDPKMYNFSSHASNSASPRSMRRLTPYTHPKSLRSILRNSPLPPPSAVAPATPHIASRFAVKLASKGPKRVEYDDPLTQTITTNTYVKSHIDLLAEDSPHSATDPELAHLDALDTTMRYTGEDEATRDGGQTPGPFEDMRRRMAESGLETPGSRKRRRKDKKRKWRWTIGEGEGEGEDGDAHVAPTTALERSPMTSIWRGGPEITQADSPTFEQEKEEEEEARGEYECECECGYERNRRGHSIDLSIFTDEDMSVSEEVGSSSSSSSSSSCSRPGTSCSL
ncbi:hypothetical protein DSL72_002878 [Monilinia vaccinii-corymbosi]|uniref:Uncharacterized protein n=1 Tax=Monilinia vaccinii-corymbosi TaxID=61207 RepID=A0A8A3PDX5_9HELO|nr:hypothetical protein DSL72_002878 [Monilinia vaccinii-corymbosi]